MMNFGDFVKKIKTEILEDSFNDLEITFYDYMIRIKLYDSFDIVIEYNGDPDDIQVIGLQTIENKLNGELYGTDFSTIRDIYEIMKLIKENHKLLDEFLK